jgi:hypothetical protein
MPSPAKARIVLLGLACKGLAEESLDAWWFFRRTLAILLTIS